uniref:Uncharacterized protein n=1 Tax=Pristionchus pacificus TaxID=54126 RepID=A0A2A6CZA7_PRIPA|eukprot:PDM83552.1 hypothetical protein PRIPAC_30039 [Pristionchus pacificus]
MTTRLPPPPPSIFPELLTQPHELSEEGGRSTVTASMSGKEPRSEPQWVTPSSNQVEQVRSFDSHSHNSFLH